MRLVSREDRIRQVAQDFLDGLSSKQIAEKYGITAGTVNRYRREAFGVQTKRVEDTRIAQLEARVKTLEMVVYNYYVGKMARVDYKPKS